MNEQERERRWALLAGLLEPVHGPALATARRLCRTAADGEDLYADTVLHAFDKLHTLREESCFKGWFFAILLSRHRSRSRLRFWRRFVPLDEAFPAGTEPPGEDGTRWSDETRRATRVAAALASLPAVQREAIVLFQLEAYSIEEIAALQRATVSAVKTRLGRGRERLRRFYEHLGITESRMAMTRGSGVDPLSTADSNPGHEYARIPAHAAFRSREEEVPRE